MNPLVYHYHPSTFEYLGGTESQLDPEEGTPLIPAQATLLEPPVSGINEVAVFESDAWLIKPDYRGQTWYSPDGTPTTFTEIGQEPATDMTSELPVDVALQQAKEEKAIEMNAMCNAVIVAGFASDALGTIHNYPSELIDQLNLNACVLESILDGTWTGPFWCETGGVWERRVHDVAQIQAVRAAGAAHVRTNQDHYKTKLQEVDNATTIEQVNSITW